MKQMYMLFFGLLVLILTGCSDHDWADTDTDKPVKVTAQIAKSRVGFNEVDNITNAYWQEGDAITLFTSSQGNLDYVAGASAGSSSSKAFTPRSGYLKAIDGEQVLACYPASPIEDGKVSLPTTTSWVDNDPMPFAYAVSSIEDSEVNLQFEHVFSFLKLTVTPSMLSDTTKAIRQMIVRTSSDEPLSVGWESTFDYSTRKANIVNGSNTIQIARDTAEVSTSWEVYLPVLPQPADADITIALMSVEGDTLYSLTKKTPSTGLEKGNVYRVGTSISYDTSFLIDGLTFNERIKQFVNKDDRPYHNGDELIRKIEFVTEVTTLPAALSDEYVEVSAADSPAPIYASFNSTDSLLTVFTAAKDIEIENASFMFFGLFSLQTIDFGNFDINEKTIETEVMFCACSSLIEVDVSNWKTDNVTTMDGMFCGCRNIKTLDVSNWNTENVMDMASMFEECSSLTNLDVSGWKTEKVENMSWMFYDCSSLTDLDVSKWETGNVTDMYAMFCDCSKLKKLDVSNWKTGRVTKMRGMFEDCSELTSLDVLGWNTLNVTDMYAMFIRCSSLTNLDVSKWKTDNVTNMRGMFEDCSKLTSLDVSNWNTLSVTDMSWLFLNCSSLTNLDVSKWKTDNVTNMRGMFEDCSQLTSLDVSGWNTLNVTDMCGIYLRCSSLTDLDVSEWKTDNVTDMSLLFCDCSNLTSLDVSNWNTLSVTDMSWLFFNCSSLTNLDVSSWNTSNVTNMANMFEDCSKLTKLAISEWKTDKVTDMYGMFCDCYKLTELDVSAWNTASVTNMHAMFEDCSELIILDLSRWETSNVTDMVWMFGNCSSLTTIDASNWNTQNVTAMDSLFVNCSSLEKLNISKWTFNDSTDIGVMFADCASSSQACRITATKEAQEFLLSRTDITYMNPDWFIWENAAGDGSSFDDIPKQEWKTTLRSRTSSIKTERMKEVNKAKRTSSKSVDENRDRLSSDHSRPHLPLSFHDSNYRIRKY